MSPLPPDFLSIFYRQKPRPLAVFQAGARLFHIFPPFWPGGAYLFLCENLV